MCYKIINNHTCIQIPSFPAFSSINKTSGNSRKLDKSYVCSVRDGHFLSIALLMCGTLFLTVLWCPTRSLLLDNKKLIRRWDSERELSLRRHCTRTKNTIDSCINSTTDRFLQHRFTKISEITQCNGHYAVQGHSRSPILVPIESSLYDFLLVINTNLPPILHRFQVMGDYWSNFR